MKKFLFFAVLAFLFTGCSGSQDVNVKDDNRTIRENVVAVKSLENSTIISSGRYDHWYIVNTPLTEGMTYTVTLDIPRQRENAQLISARLIDFSPGDFLQRDVFARYKMAYNQVSTGNNFPEDQEEQTASKEEDRNE